MGTDGSWRDAVVRAGATQPAYIEEKAGLHPELFFRFKVQSPVEAEKQIITLRDSGTEEGIKHMHKTVSELITEWSLDCPLGEMLRKPLLTRVFWIIMQDSPTDPIPGKYADTESVGDVAKK